MEKEIILERWKEQRTNVITNENDTFLYEHYNRGYTPNLGAAGEML